MPALNSEPEVHSPGQVIMSRTLHQFGMVLFDELEQVAVRRGGFASLKWVKRQLLKAQRGVEELGKKAADPTVDLPSPRKKPDECARQVRDALALAPQTAEAVKQLGRIMLDLNEALEEVRKKLMGPPVDGAWKDRVAEVERALARHAKDLQEAQEALKVHVQVIRGQFEKAIHAASLARERADPQDLSEQDARDAVVLRWSELASALGTAAGRFEEVSKAFGTMARVKAEPLEDLRRMVLKQSRASKYEIYEIVEEAARKSAMRMKTIGLAFSGGGIRSATFNLGFLQGAAAPGGSNSLTTFPPSRAAATSAHGWRPGSCAKEAVSPDHPPNSTSFAGSPH